MTGAKDAEEARTVAYAVAEAQLVRCALNGGDPNWGRILAAVGRAGVEAMILEKVQIYLNEVCIVRNGGVADDYTETLKLIKTR